MTNNNKLQSDIAVAKVSISALEKEYASVAEVTMQTRETIKQKFNKVIETYEANLTHSFIPTKMKESIEFFISDSTIRPRWKDYEREGYTNQLDIYYYSPENYNNRGTDNHSWEISSSSFKLHVNTNPVKDQKDNEAFDKTIFAIGMKQFIESNKEALIELHREWSENESRVYTISSAIDKLKRDISDAEREMVNNDIIRMVKPGGETAIYLFNKDIPMFANTKYQYTRRHSVWFDAIRLIKETKKGVKVEFLNYSKDDEGNITNKWVSETKVVDFQTLISIIRGSKDRFEENEKRRIEKEERENKALETQTS